jgi:transposase
MRARVLLKADEGLKDKQIAEHLDITVQTVEKVRKQCVLDGIDATLTPKKRPPGKPKLDGEGEAWLVQIACSEPPDGRQRWTLRLLMDKLVELEVTDRISHETVRQCLKKKRAETLANA